MIIKKLLIGTSNKNKFKELKLFFSGLKIKVIFAGNINLPIPKETGSNFNENALIKAKNYSSSSKLLTIADDSGLVIPSIHKFPGIYSKKWITNMGKNYLFKYLQKILENKSPQAYFVCSLCFYNSVSKNFKIFTGHSYGTISFPPRGKNGFGYDPIFIPKGYSQTFSELGQKIKNKISHRAIAYYNLLHFLKNNETF